MTFSCPVCNTQLKVEDDLAGRTVVCPNCKKSIVVPVKLVITKKEAEKGAAAAPSVIAQPYPANGMKYCHECGRQIRVQAEICPECGVRQPDRLNEPIREHAAGGQERITTRGFKCPYCGTEKPPIIGKRVSGAGWVLFVVLLLFCICLCWLPFVIDGCYDVTRTCPGCGVKLG